ncbi:hypothetical protein Ga0080574_TMP2453 [Salipiger abyssi]|uniref:Uncharacterized protein n=1 Tax=Salipiger abyssi TaxID=1250539 RepID=A0A1P8UTQ9_9RHOB|nr:hypothetical protein Ga0080574_TMP2453 [Salipiger abyssi]
MVADQGRRKATARNAHPSLSSGAFRNGHAGMRCVMVIFEVRLALFVNDLSQTATETRNIV